MMILLGHDMRPLMRFQPESMALNLEERNSTATITVGPDAPEIKINDWVKDETEPGAGIVWRVKTVSESIETETRTISLEHVVQYLKDQVIFGEVTAKTITGNKNATKCTAREAAVYAMGKQSLWQLGELEASASNPYSYNGDTVYAALETVTESLPDMQWEYDLRTLPFTLHIRKHPTGFQSEMRMRRNITTMKVQVDRTRMYTRLYPIGKNNLHIAGDYVSKNESTWGIVCKVETESSKDDKTDLKNWALERLERHCEPLVTVTVTGLELSDATGEPLDHIVVGRRCRIPLPDYGTAMTERVTKMSWADKIKEPEKVTVTLANQLEDVASIVSSLSSSSSKSSRNNAKKDEEDHAWFVDTTTHVAMVAEAVAGPGSGEDWSRVASVVVDGQGIHQRVVRTEGEVVAMWSSIEVLEDRIVLEVANAKSDTFSKIEQTASSIRTEVNRSKSTIYSTIMQTATNIYTQVGNAKSGLYSKIEQTASSIRSEVNSSKSTIFSTIMQTATNIYTQVGNAKSDTYSKIEQTASSITSTVSSAKSSLFSSIMQTATNIYTQVGNAKSGLYSSIEQTASQITLKANKVWVDGELEGLTAKFDSITVKEGSATYLQSGKVYATTSLHVGWGSQGGGGTLYYRGTAYYPNFVVLKDSGGHNISEGTVLGTGNASSSLDMTHYHEIEVEQGTGTDAGKLIVTLGKPSSSAGSANFNIADTQIYKDGVSAAKNSVKVKAFTANSVTLLASHRTFTYTTDATNPVSGAAQVDTWHLVPATSWSSGSKTVYMRYGSTTGTTYAQVSVTIAKSDITIPTNWTSSSTDPDADVLVNINKNYTYHKATISVGGRTKTVRLKLIS